MNAKNQLLDFIIDLGLDNTISTQVSKMITICLIIARQDVLIDHSGHTSYPKQLLRDMSLFIDTCAMML